MKHTPKQRWTKRLLGGFVGMFLCAYIFMFSVAPALATGLPVVDIAAQAERQASRVELTIGEALLTSALQSLMNTAQFFIRKISYDTAVYLASGGKGQGALIEQQNFGAYLEGVALDTVGEAIHQIGEPFGLNLCEMPDIKLQAFIQIGLRDLYSSPPQPNCSWQQLKQGWSEERFLEKYGPGFSKLIPEKFSDVVSVNRSDFGVTFNALAQVDRFTAGKEQAAAFSRITNRGFKAVQDTISGQIVTPASVLEEEVKGLTATKEGDRSNVAIAGIYGTESLNLIPYAAQVFLSTFASTLLKRAFSDGIVPPNARFTPNQFGIFRSNREAARRALTDFLGVRVRDVPEYDIVTRFSACPRNPKLDNCVMDADLAAAVARGNIPGEALTIREAIDEGLLHGDWPLMSPRREVDNTDRNCYKRAYCYSNIQKMRKARLLPLGFEIAAFKADPSNPENWTLEKIVNNFANCTPPNDQYCHLIDPNWVIKSPVASCPSEAFGPNLVTGRSPNRSQECVDLATCIATDEEGKCISQGFCTKEKNTWRFIADSCRAEYATCRTFERSAGTASSYLSRTVDFGRCSEDNVGCRTYSIEQNAQGEWLRSDQLDLTRKVAAPGQNQLLYFNSKINNHSCSTADDGCSIFYSAARDANEQVDRNAAGAFQLDKTEPIARLKKAPDYLGCYDTNPNILGNQRPTTLSQIQTDISQDARCNNYAGACLASEVGCESYTQPTDPTAPAIPGIIGQNGCTAACVGYDNYKQLATSFESASFPLYFVPQEGQVCDSAYVGCDEFTNLDESSAGGEQLEYYTKIKYCEKPADTNQKNFYSWEGSDDEGFVLRVHNLRPMVANDTAYIVGTNPTLPTGLDAATFFRVGSPAYADDSRETIELNVDICNESDYLLRVQDQTDPNAAALDCRALYDDDGEVYYRLLADTITVSDACRRLRKTNAELFTDTTLTNQAACTTKGGNWAPPATGGADSCQRCVGGGQYANGTCIYNAIPGDTESRACPAAANQCRQYVGNTGRDINTGVVVDDFEGQNALQSWGVGLDGTGANPANLRTAAEAIVVGGNSLRIDAQAVARQIATSSLAFGASYELSFWARGTVQNITISFGQNGAVAVPITVDPNTGNTRSISVGDSWREYRVGPVALDLDFTQSDTIELIFQRTNGNGPYFVDHVRLSQLQDQIFLIKNSWRRDYNNDGQVTDAPNVCDANPNDGFPGIALGCSEYNDSKGRQVFATGFEQLCREEAVGCEPLWDTYNTYSSNINDLDETRMHVYNLGCEGQQGRGCTLSVRFDANTVEEYKCQIDTEETVCIIPQRIIIPDAPFQFPRDIGGSDSAVVVSSTIIIPADTDEAQPIFLASGIDGRHNCSQSGVGCIQAGRETLVLPDKNDPNAYTFAPVFVKNDPALYTVDNGQGGEVAGTLCQDDVVGCERFTSENETVYFKDPNVIGQALCQYQEGVVLANGTTINGWFYANDVGQCSNGNLCRSDGDCGGVGACTQRNVVPCYPDFLRRSSLQGVVYDIRSNDSPLYDGLVGQCPQEQHLCTEYVDPSDVSNKFPTGRPYYVLKNQKITSKQQECEAGVSRVEGCILFDETNRPGKPFHSATTYAASAAANPAFRQVPAQSAPDVALNDANVVLKVDRDRECAEWLSCRSAIVQIEEDGTKSELCYDYRACDSINPDGTCANWVGQNELSLLPLTESRYTQRAVGWNDPDYSGYTVFNKRQINDYEYISFDLSVFKDAVSDQDDKDTVQRLADTQYLVYPFRNADDECLNPNGTPRDAFVSCAPNEQGRCIAGRCYAPTEGSFPPFAEITSSSLLSDPATNLAALLGNLVSGSCKAYPEEDGPFPQTVLSEEVQDLDASNPVGNIRKPGVTSNIRARRTDFGAKKQGFERANVCQDGVDCSCKYNKIVYGGGGPTDYWVTESRSIGIEVGKGVCVGGDNAGQPCVRNGTSCTNGTCQFVERKETHVGLSGFCLERDLSRPINGASVTGSNNQEYACLTWLPVEVSASTIDVFNTHLSAGYHPDVDARGPTGNSGPYGELYCTQATQVGGGVYARGAWGTNNTPTETSVAGLTAQYFTPNTPDANRGFFVPNGDPRLGDERRDCSAQSFNRATGNGTTSTVQVRGISIDFPYQSLACDYQFGFRNTYQVMKVWGWRQLGPNAELLRFEKKPELTNNGNRRSREDIVGEKDYRGASGSSNLRFVQHFAPNPFSNEGGTYGTVMHPPRDFGQSSINQQYQSASQSFSYNRLDRSSQRISAAVYEPSGFRGGGDSSTNGAVFTYPGEELLREADISRIYFVPTHYPHGNEGAMPQLLTDTMYIDFINLKANPSRAEVGSVEAIFDDDAVWPDGNYLSDPSTFSGNIGDASYPIPSHSSKRWTYLIERDHEYDSGLQADSIGFTETPSPATAAQLRTDYPFDFSINNQGGVFDPLRSSMNAEHIRRNQIAKRYVLVWVTDIVGNERKVFPSFIPATGGEGSSEIQATRPQSRRQDPFEVPFDCSSAGPEHENWIAIGLDFNAEGDFLGYISRFCNNTPVDGGHDSNAAAFAVFATLKDRCTEVVQVYDDSSTGSAGQTNKAWTQRVWQHAQNVQVGGNNIMLHPFGLSSNFDLYRSDENPPFGSLNLGSADITDQQLVRNATFRYPDTVAPGGTVFVPSDGIPYSCSFLTWFGFPSFGAAGSCNALQENGNPSNTGNADREYQGRVSTAVSGRTVDFGRDRVHDLFAKFYAVAISDGTFEQEEGTARGRRITINSRIPTLNYSTSTVDRSGPAGNGNFGNAGGVLRPPQVYSLNPSTCKGTSRFGINEGCTAGDVNNITINDRNSTLKNYDRDAQNIREEDRDNDGNIDPIIGNIIYAATAQFFAFADDNRMPIHRVMVDWGDNTQIINSNRSGLYKNRKPFCSTTDSPTVDIGLCGTSPAALDLTGVTCKTHNDCPVPDPGAPAQRCYGPIATDDLDESQTYQFSRFGNARRACTAKPFIFTHDYTCTAQDVDQTPADYTVEIGTIANAQARNILINQYGLEPAARVCVFQPRVQVLDNWGWCSAINPNTGENEGLWNDGPGIKLCDTRDAAWIPYQGEIYVVPPT